MALEDRTQGGTLVDGMYVYETDVILNATGDFNSSPTEIDWVLEDLIHYIDNGGQVQKRLRGFSTGNLIGYYVYSGKYAGKEVFAATNSCYIFVQKEPPVITDPPPREKPPMPKGQVFKQITVDQKLFQIEHHFQNLWNNEGTLLRSHFLSGSQDSYDYWVDVFDTHSGSDCPEKTFTAIYGNYNGSGSVNFGGDDDETLSKAMYSQYANILLRGEDKFIISGSEVDSVAIIDVPRSRYRDSIKVGSWKFDIGKYSIDSGSLSGSKIPSGSTVDDIVTYDATVKTYVDEYYGEKGQPEFLEGPISIVESGSIDEVGLFYPTQGTFIFNADVFGPDFDPSDAEGFNAYGLYKAISGSSAASTENGLNGQSFKYNYSNYYFLNANNYEFNFSNNPTYVSGSDGQLIGEVDTNHVAYITTVGLYNEDKDLLAVGKISMPISKNFTEEASFTVKLEK